MRFEDVSSCVGLLVHHIWEPRSFRARVLIWRYMEQVNAYFYSVLF